MTDSTKRKPMRQRGYKNFRWAVWFDSFKFKYTPWSDCYILQLGYLQLGWIRK